MLVITICGLAFGVGIDEMARGDWVGGIVGVVPILLIMLAASWKRGVM